MMRSREIGIARCKGVSGEESAEYEILSIEIAELKRRSSEDAARWRQMEGDKRWVGSGIDPESSDPTLPIAMARAMGALFIDAKRSRNVDPDGRQGIGIPHP